MRYRVDLLAICSRVKLPQFALLNHPCIQSAKILENNIFEYINHARSYTGNQPGAGIRAQ